MPTHIQPESDNASELAIDAEAREEARRAPNGAEPADTTTGTRSPSSAESEQERKPPRSPNEPAIEGREVPPSSVAEPTPAVPELSRTEKREVVKRTAISAVVVHEAIREEGERELRRAPAALVWSALAAGLSMGFSMVGQGLLRAYLPDQAWRPVISSFGYSLGFLIVILGRQQLFTENTLTVILPLLAHPNRKTFLRVLRLWAIVLFFNLLGAFIFASIAAHTDLFPDHVNRALTAIGRDSLRGSFGLVVMRGIFAGWLIALMVWLLPSAENARIHIIILITYIVSLGGFAHIIAGSAEVMYAVSKGAVTWSTYLGGFMAPTLVGNLIGGMALVAALNFAQVTAEAAAENAESGTNMQPPAHPRPVRPG